jgi:RNA polymerase sporulation-specific sigma factor
MDVVSDQEDLTETFCKKENAKRIRAAVENCLTPQEQTVIRLRYGLDGNTPQRQREVADRTGISRSYVSRIEKRALEKLRTAMED